MQASSASSMPDTARRLQPIAGSGPIDVGVSSGLALGIALGPGWSTGIETQTKGQNQPTGLSGLLPESSVLKKLISIQGCLVCCLSRLFLRNFFRVYQMIKHPPPIPSNMHGCQSGTWSARQENMEGKLRSSNKSIKNENKA